MRARDYARLLSFRLRVRASLLWFRAHELSAGEDKGSFDR